MDGDLIDNILEPFFSTQGFVQGTEPGLPVVVFALLWHKKISAEARG